MELDARVPFDPRSHRPYVREFIELVRLATGKLYSAEIYRRLLDAYAPSRRPSMSTLASERERAGRLAAPVASAIEDFASPSSGSSLGLAEFANAVADAVETKLGQMLNSVQQVQNAQLEFYQFQLQEAETELRALRDRLAAVSAELAVARQGADQYRAAAESTRATLDEHVRTIDTLSRNADDMRKFALMSIEDARGEARTWKARCVELELQRERDMKALDALRRAHYETVAAAAREQPE